MNKTKVILVVALALGFAATAQAWEFSEDFTDTAWRGGPVWGGWAYELVDGTHDWTVVSAQDGGIGRAYVRADTTQGWSAGVSSVKDTATESSITYTVPSLTDGTVTFSFAEGYYNTGSSLYLQFFGPGDVLASALHFGGGGGGTRTDAGHEGEPQPPLVMTANDTASTVFIAAEDDMTAGYGVDPTPIAPADFIFSFDCADSGTVTVDASNDGGPNIADGIVADFATAVDTIEYIRFLAGGDDPDYNSELNIGGTGGAAAYSGITFTGTATSSPKAPGDANGDGKVTIADFLALQNHFNQAGAWEDGDFNDDGQVTIADFLILQNNWGYGTANAGAVPTIPEPITLALFGLGGLALIRRRR